MVNTHTRVLDHPIEAVRPWVERAWSGTSDDVFPRDRIPTWRKNPDGGDSSALVPGVTKMGHGPFSFTLREWDGFRWRVDVASGSGWHGFDLEVLDDRVRDARSRTRPRTRITHTLDVPMDLAFRLVILPMHDWAVESLFDRLEVALATGVVPLRTERRMSVLTQTFSTGVRTYRKLARRLTAASL
jgi:hypothetical protein